MKLQRSNIDFAEKAEEHIRKFKQLLEAAEQRTSEEKARRAEEKKLYEEEMVRVREEGDRRVEQVGKMAKEITQQVKEEASRRTEERRGHAEEVKRVREEGNRRVERISNMADEINRQVKEEATLRAEERSEILKRAEDATKKAQEAIAAALAGKEEAERRSAKLMEEAEAKIQKAVEEAMMRVEPRKGNPRTERQWNSEVPDSDADIEAVQDLVQIPTAGSSNRGMDDESSLEKLPSRGMNQKVTFSNFHSFFWLKFFQNSIKKLAHVQPAQMSRVHFEEVIPAFADVEIDNTEGEVDEGAIDETRKGNRMEDVEMRMNSQDVEADMTDDIYVSTDEDAETGGKKKKNKASSFSPF